MTTLVDIEKTYSIEEFYNLPNNGKRYELVEGKLVEMAPASRKHGKIKVKLLIRLGIFVEQNKLGEVHPSDTGFILSENTVRAPDMAFIAASRLTDVSEDGYIPVPPDLAVEVVSPIDRWTEINDKIEEYLQAGVKLVWIINTRPRHKVIYVYHAGSSEYQTLQTEDELSGEDVIPGFKLKVSELFD